MAPGLEKVRQDLVTEQQQLIVKSNLLIVKNNLPDVQAGFKKGRGTRDQISNISWIMEKAREFQKNISFCFIDYAKAFDCVDHNKLWTILDRKSVV